MPSSSRSTGAIMAPSARKAATAGSYVSASTNTASPGRSSTCDARKMPFWLPRVMQILSPVTCNPRWLRSIDATRSEEHTSELQSLMRISYAVFCLKKKKTETDKQHVTQMIQTHYKKTIKNQQKNINSKNT